MFSRYYLHSNVFSIHNYSTTHWHVTRSVKVHIQFYNNIRLHRRHSISCRFWRWQIRFAVTIFLKFWSFRFRILRKSLWNKCYTCTSEIVSIIHLAFKESVSLKFTRITLTDLFNLWCCITWNHQESYYTTCSCITDQIWIEHVIDYLMTQWTC